MIHKPLSTHYIPVCGRQVGENFGKFGKCHSLIFYPDSLKQLMLAIVNSPTFSLPKLQNNRFTKVLPCHNFALYGIPITQSSIAILLSLPNPSCPLTKKISLVAIKLSNADAAILCLPCETHMYSDAGSYTELYQIYGS